MSVKEIETAIILLPKDELIELVKWLSKRLNFPQESNYQLKDNFSLTNTESGASILGNVMTEGGDFTGRDKDNSNYHNFINIVLPSDSAAQPKSQPTSDPSLITGKMGIDAITAYYQGVSPSPIENIELKHILDLFEDRPMRSIQTIQILAEALSKGNRMVLTTPESIMQVFMRRIKNWIEKVIQNPDDDLVFLIGSSLKAISAIQGKNSPESIKIFIAEQAKVFSSISDPEQKLQPIKTGIEVAQDWLETGNVNFKKI